MSSQLGTSPLIHPESTEGTVTFHDCIGDNGRCSFSHLMTSPRLHDRLGNRREAEERVRQAHVR